MREAPHSPSSFAAMAVNMKVSELQIGTAMLISVEPSKKKYRKLPLWFTKKGIVNLQFASVAANCRRVAQRPVPATFVSAASPPREHRGTRRLNDLQEAQTMHRGLTAFKKGVSSAPHNGHYHK